MKLINTVENIMLGVSSTINSRGDGGTYFKKIAEETNLEIQTIGDKSFMMIEGQKFKNDLEKGLYLCVFHTTTFDFAKLGFLGAVLLSENICRIGYFIFDTKNKKFVETSKEEYTSVYNLYIKKMGKEKIQKVCYTKIVFGENEGNYIGFIFSASKGFIHRSSMVVTKHKTDDYSTKNKIEGVIPAIRRMLNILAKDKNFRNDIEISTMPKPSFGEVLKHDKFLIPRIAFETEYLEEDVKDAVEYVKNELPKSSSISDNVIIDGNFESWVRFNNNSIEEVIAILTHKVIKNDIYLSDDMINVLNAYITEENNRSQKAEEMITQLQVLREIRATNAYLSEEFELQEEIREDIELDNETILIQKLKKSKRFISKIPEQIKGITSDVSRETLFGVVGNLASGVVPASFASFAGWGTLATLAIAGTGLLMVGIGGHLKKQKKLKKALEGT